MAESDRALEVRRRRAVFRAWHRGIRETDLILGRFADAHAAHFSEPEIVAFEAVLDMPDHDILAWVTGQAETPPEHASAMLARVAAFYRPSF